ncbi:MAG: hypothetical protein ABH807_00885 [Candidatus Shapirobacteria bacterium]
MLRTFLETDASNKARNLTTHTYEEDLAKKIYKRIKNFDQTLDVFLVKVEKFLKI